MPLSSEVNIEKYECLSPEAFREGMAGLAAAVNIITTGDSNRKAGFTATAVCSVSDSPATLLVCLNRSASAYPYFLSNDALSNGNLESTISKNTPIAINTLSAKQTALSNLFGGKTPMEERFMEGEWETLKTGAPILKGAAIAFDCRISDIKSVATHDVIFCEVLAIQKNSDSGSLLYYQRNYHEL
ncbi:flavin reductase [Marinibactrum halimedae]|uniref:FMN reductase (NADH) RutF n=1 Tax=Marinibactrum halimedae TaxID=1444977 RepID=A0AA37TDB9_9GAMM|nr:flavin reductase [Marinibactrum halimedae]MCD9457969.1 flavin reductase [Marinibactrum halimedae]GLS27595.1 FMN reductase (NADH) RutF [Marinibactrum halimedae]